MGQKSADGGSSASSDAVNVIPELVNGRFEVKQKIGSGSYSEVHLGIDRVVGDKVAVKIEWTKAEKTNKLLHEAQLYENMTSGSDIPLVRWWGSQGEHNIMVMELLGPSLEDYFTSCGNKFSLKTVLMIGEQMIDRIEYCHKLGILHRDIKPNNFLMGLGERSTQVYVMDFGLAKRYIDLETGRHQPCNKKKGLTGTVRYTTLNVHRCLEPSRRDDVGSIGYVLMYFLRGRLPWQGVNAKSKKTKQRRIGRRKEETTHAELCSGFPSEFLKYFEYCDSLGYEDAPDYDYLRRLMNEAFVREHFERDFKFDWMIDLKVQLQVRKEERKRARELEIAVAEEKRVKPTPPVEEGGKDKEDEEDEYDYEYESESEEEESEEETEESDEDPEEGEGKAPQAAK